MNCSSLISSCNGLPVTGAENGRLNLAEGAMKERLFLSFAMVATQIFICTEGTNNLSSLLRFINLGGSCLNSFSRSKDRFTISFFIYMKLRTQPL